MLPREKMQKFGPNVLTNDELLAIIIGSGSKNNDVFMLAKRIIGQDDCINELLNLTLEELMKIKGIKFAKAAKVIASIELAKRIFKDIPNDLQINNPAVLYNYLKSDFLGKKQEEFVVLFLDKKLQLIKKRIFAIGNDNMIAIDIKEILKYALKYDSHNLIVAHNHPSNTLDASSADIECTKALVKQAAYFDITIIDHLIITANGYYSFVENHKI